MLFNNMSDVAVYLAAGRTANKLLNGLLVYQPYLGAAELHDEPGQCSEHGVIQHRWRCIQHSAFWLRLPHLLHHCPHSPGHRHGHSQVG